MFQVGCLPRPIQADVNHLNAGFCANMMIEVKEIEAAGFPEKQQDLFMEIRKSSPTYNVTILCMREP